MRKLFTSVALGMVAFLLLPTLGCRSDGENGGSDVSYLRVPDAEAEVKPVLQHPLTALFPLGPSRRWEMSVRVIDRANPTRELRTKPTTESIKVGTPRTIGGVPNAFTLDMTQPKKPLRQEIYALNAKELRLVAAGAVEKMRMAPPMTLIKANAPQGEMYFWEGTITFKGREAPAKATSRVGPVGKITVPAGTFEAYRIDTSLTTVVEGREITFPASRWFAPGIGLVKQTFSVGRLQIVKELTKYKTG